MHVTEQIETVLGANRTMTDERREEDLVRSRHRRMENEKAVCRKQSVDTNGL